MLQKTAQYMKIYRMAEPGEKLVVGLSGGMDSVCLFHVLCLLGYETVAVHVHHGIRGAEADRDEAFVRRLCEKYGAEFYGYRFDVPKLSRMEHLSVEEEGRKVRRQAFFEVMEKTGAGHIALAHHGNDRAETMLFHLSRGTGIRGLASMRPCEGSSSGRFCGRSEATSKLTRLHSASNGWRTGRTLPRNIREISSVMKLCHGYWKSTRKASRISARRLISWRRCRIIWSARQTRQCGNAPYVRRMRCGLRRSRFWRRMKCFGFRYCKNVWSV